MEKEEITTNDYLKGIVLNLPDSPGIYQYFNSERTPQRQDTITGQQNCRYPLYRGKNRRRRSFTRKQPDKEIQATLQCIAER